MKTFSLDLRTRILAACDKHDSTRQHVAERFGVSLGFVKKLLGQRKRLGIVDNLYFRVGRKQAVSKEKAAQMREYVRLHPGATAPRPEPVAAGAYPGRHAAGHPG